MLDGALCAFAVMASMQSLKAPGRMAPTRRQALRDAAGVGAAVIVAYGMATGFDSTLLALAIAAFAMLTPRFGRSTPASLQSALALAALASASAGRAPGFDPGASLEWTALGGIVAIALAFVLCRVRFRVSNTKLASTMHFACAALCTVIAYTAG